jgi:hypothetical protein
VYENLDQSGCAGIHGHHPEPRCICSLKRRGADQAGANSQTLSFGRSLMDSRTLFLTCQETVFGIGCDTEVAVCRDPPAEVCSGFIDHWFRYVTVSVAGPTKVRAASTSLLPSSYDGTVCPMATWFYVPQRMAAGAAFVFPVDGARPRRSSFQGNLEGLSLAQSKESAEIVHLSVRR